MSIQTISDFSARARTDSVLAGKLKACEKLRDLLKLAREEGFDVEEELFYPPNEPQFTADQLSEKLANALLRF
ncbi:Nif11-like leader peptide family natural product precursor [Mariprofundus ferrooxydans]|uniref:Nif11-like leader peptide family natural product precursor n=1 Tax=Mariprofundus ferrooxydans TaxID=314344 RepID=UPI000360B5B0|nr:Nif11-like leader peptide family natural product precursor [Mariprofundus ferrooxydans]